jgi:hypothetical protein
VILEVVILGHPRRLRASSTRPLLELVRAALKSTGNDPSRAWELRSLEGELIDLARSPLDADVRDNARLYLSPRAGVAA